MTTTDDLILRLNDAAYRFGDSYPVDAARQREAAAALTRLQARVAELEAKLCAAQIILNGDRDGYAAWQKEKKRAERAEDRVKELEAENARLIEHLTKFNEARELAESERDEFSRSIDKICTERDKQLRRVCAERDEFQRLLGKATSERDALK